MSFAHTTVLVLKGNAATILPLLTFRISYFPPVKKSSEEERVAGTVPE